MHALLVPVLAEGISADAWTIAEPLLLLVMLPMLVGLAAQSVSPLIAAKVALVTNTAVKYMTLLLLVIVFSTNFFARGILHSIGAYAIVTQLLFCSISSTAAYWLSPGLKPNQKSVLSLGMSARNLGVAFAPLLSVQQVNQQAMVMVAVAIPIQYVVVWFAARQFARQALIADTLPAAEHA